MLSGVLWAGTAFADGCDNVEKSRAWETNYQELTRAYQNEDWNAALGYSKALEEMCDTSPTLNYTIARIYKNLDNQEKYLFYLQKSTQNTDRYVVDKDTLDKIWSEKYIAVNPEADPERIRQRQEELDAQNEELTLLREQVKAMEQSANYGVVLRDEVSMQHSLDDALLWTSVAVGGAGLIMAGVGAAFVAQNNDKAIAAKNNDLMVKSDYTLGWGLLGAGIGATVVGVAMSGFFGYKYHKNHSSTADTMSIMLSPTYSSVSLTF